MTTSETLPVEAGRLLELAVSDLALIDRMRLPLEAGLNVLTGETGAGKSLLIDALGLATDRSKRAHQATTRPSSASETAAIATLRPVPTSWTNRWKNSSCCSCVVPCGKSGVESVFAVGA